MRNPDTNENHVIQNDAIEDRVAWTALDISYKI